MEIGEIVEVGERKVEVTPRQEPERREAPAPAPAPAAAPEREWEDA